MLEHSILATPRSSPLGFASKHLIVASCTLVAGQAIVLASLGPRAPGPFLSGLVQLVLGLICILACIQAFRRSHSIARFAWRLLGLTFPIWAIAQALGVYVEISGRHSLDSLADILFSFSVLPFGILPLHDPDGESNSFDTLHVLDFVQVGIFSVSIFLCFSPRMWSPATALHVGPFLWSRNLALDGLLVATLVLRAFLTSAQSVRLLLARMAAFLLLSGLADSYALSPKHNLQAGGWFDLIWSALLGIPIMIAGTWTNADQEQTDRPSKSHNIAVNQVFPLLYPLVTFFNLARADRVYSFWAPALLVAAVIIFAIRVLIIQHRQGEAETKLRFEVKARKHTEEMLRQSETAYRLLFDSNPFPMWVFDRKTLKFLAVNEASSRQYGFSDREFLTMTIADIRPEEDFPALLEATTSPSQGLQEASIWRHRKKNGAIIDVEIISHHLDFHGIGAELIAARDVTERRNAAETVKRLASIVEFSQDAIIGKNLDGAITSWNQAAEKMYGYSNTEVIGRNLSFLLPVERQAELQVIMERIQMGLPIRTLETQRLTKAGSLLDVSLSISPIKDARGRVTGASTIARDITAHKRADEQLKLQSTALEAAANAIVITDSHGSIVWVNAAFTTMTGYSKEEVLGKNPRLLKSGDQPQSYYADLWSTISSGKVWRGEIVNRRKNGTAYTEEMTITPVTRDSADPGDRYFIAIKQDITARKNAEQRVQYLAYYDDLTGLANRTLFLDRLATAVADARRQRHKVALLFLDLDGFKDINDSLGHSVGDLLLQGVAERLKKWGREQDTIARLGGDEFLVMLPHVMDAPDAAVATERLMNVFDGAFYIQGHSLNVSCSLGISIFPEHGEDGESLVKNADAAMYTAKQCGRNSFRFFTEDLNTQAVERLTLENSLRSALTGEQLFLMYQPQLDVATGRIVGLEALLRWQHPNLGLVPPDKFIRIARTAA